MFLNLPQYGDKTHDLSSLNCKKWKQVMVLNDKAFFTFAEWSHLCSFVFICHVFVNKCYSTPVDCTFGDHTLKRYS